MDDENGTIRLGLLENVGQFSLLVLINVFVGMMVGLERTVVPLIGEKEFGLVSKTAIVSFIVSFGVTKAICNLFAARVSETVGRKKVLVLGWLIGLPVPFIIIFANHWFWFNIANILLGINQALCWSMTVIMKVDLVGPKRRGLALGLNEFAGYLAVGFTAWITGYIASVYALRPQPFYLGIGEEMKGHESVNHAEREYVRGVVTTNMAEGYFSQLKRSQDGTHHHVSSEHLGRYTGEFDFRYTTCKLADSERAVRMVGQAGGKRLTYDGLTGHGVRPPVSGRRPLPKRRPNPSA